MQGIWKFLVAKASVMHKGLVTKSVTEQKLECEISSCVGIGEFFFLFDVGFLVLGDRADDNSFYWTGEFTGSAANAEVFH